LGYAPFASLRVTRARRSACGSLAFPGVPLLRIPARPDGPHEDLVDAFSRLAARASRCGAHRHRRSIPTARADPDGRAELERFRDSLAGTVDSIGLLAWERRTIDLAKVDRNNTLVTSSSASSRSGWASWADRRTTTTRPRSFQWAIDLQPTWPYPW